MRETRQRNASMPPLQHICCNQKKMIYNNVFFILALGGAAVNAHICMWAPVQRNGYSIDTPGESKCYLKEGPCGGVASGEPQTVLNAGQDYTILFQQNLNHYYLENPGQLVADYATNANPAEGDFVALGTPVADYNAMNEVTQTNFTMKVQVPNVQCDNCVIRLRYVSQNPTENDRGMTFYQCADVRINKSGEAAVPSPVKMPVAQPESHASDCCAPKQFTVEGYETGSWRNPTAKKYYFDAANKLFRVDTNSGTGTTPKDGNFQMISNFTSGIEYYYNVAANTCDLYGLNYWSDWCYGSYNQQTYLQSVMVGETHATVWQKPGTPFTWTNTQHSCVPVSQTRIDIGEATFFYNFKEGAPDASVFNIPAACVRAQAALKDVKSLKPALPHHAIF